MEAHKFYRWSPRFLYPPVKDGILMKVSARQWSCTFHHTKKYGFHHNLSFDCIFGRFVAPGPFSFSMGSAYVQCRIDSRGRSSAIWSVPESHYSAVTSTDGATFSLNIEWKKCFYRADARLGTEPEFSCVVGNSAFVSMIQLSNEFTSTAMQLTHGPFTTAIGYVVDRMEFMTPPIHCLLHYSGKSITANLTMSYFDKWYQRSAFAWQRGHFKVGFRNRADRFFIKSLKDFSYGVQFNLTEALQLSFGYCRGKALVQWRKQVRDRCYVQGGGYLVKEKNKVTPKLFLLIDYQGSRAGADQNKKEDVTK
jgi:hypothetical protein